MQNQIVSSNFNGISVFFSNDAYLNATEIAKQFGKRPVDFLKTEQTKEYISCLAKKMSEVNKITSIENQLVIVRKGNFSKEKQGTWLHPKLAIVFARWLSAEFAVWCDEQIENMLHPVLTQQMISIQQQHEIKEAVSQNVGRTGRTFKAVYHDLYIRFQIPKYQDLLAKDFDEAIKYLGTPQLEFKKGYDFPLETAEPHDKWFANALMTPKVMLNKENRAPDLELLEVLEHDGYDVGGAKIRIFALYSIARDFLAVQNDLKTVKQHLAFAERLVKDSIVERGNNVTFVDDLKNNSVDLYRPQF